MIQEEPSQLDRREAYKRAMAAIRTDLTGRPGSPEAGMTAVAARSFAVDELVRELWAEAVKRDARLAAGVAVLAVGGYGRRQLFPYSDVDVIFLLDGKLAEKDVKDAIRTVNQALWDAGLRVSPMTRTLAECDQFDPENVEFTLSLLDQRSIAGNAELQAKLADKVLPKLIARDRKKIVVRLLEITRARHAKYGDTLFHLEPNVKECPGGLRDIHVCEWLAKLSPEDRIVEVENEEFREAREFLCLVRCFLHLRHERDDNMLDWYAQDAAAAAGVGIGRPGHAEAAYWMRFYFRHARSVERRATLAMDEAAAGAGSKALPGWRIFRRVAAPEERGFQITQGRVELAPATAGFEGDPAHDPDVVLRIFAVMAQTGSRLGSAAEARLAHGLPLISANLEDGPALWHQLKTILTGRHAGESLRAMHALGILELLIPEFHGIDALVIRDAYHRYTVDEHTFVLIDTLHGLDTAPEPNGKLAAKPGPGIGEWASRFGGVLRELPHPELLYLAALLHDTGKGRSSTDHPHESARMAESVLSRLELDSYECGLVLSLIRNHLEMPAALRRDVFDAETVRAFAAKVPTPEALRMLALFTYADICAVHPDALTPWKAENLWRLYITTANFLDRSVDDERVGAQPESELVHRLTALLPGQKTQVMEFLEGFPERYVLTRTPEQVRTHFLMAQKLAEESVQLDFRYAPGISEITLVTPDRELLFARVAGALAGWGMNIVSADAFSNRQGIVVDSFRFTDSFKTLEMNASEHERFVASVHDVMTGKVPVERLLGGRRRTKRKAPKVLVEARVDFDDEASSHSTLLQVVAQDTPGLLRALSLTIGERGCNIEVALVDTEGEMAIDVFYIRRAGAKLDVAEQESMRQELLQAMEENARS
ncbi:UTP--GlnB (protein PII) uridylyltransferase, GlnD [Granulicella rosea]|uniref:Bifunctional uridylyltransferase/uridylyl-removing enzyme n=1 Tax=Granulicella rosea TaxID=474952 RepID=A0A239IY91_9BACT|nr:[protein-PII] uridylyltransferase [Granulicella rosea]SNS98591.1 UTP--GlnB (protein PII) uridylyltransferase, GlnD [Granulicella rosea]